MNSAACAHEKYAQQVARLAARVISKTDLHSYEGGLAHMGAVLVDTVLQAGINYRTVVLPRVRDVFRRFPAAITTPAFYDVLILHGAEEVLQWRHPTKPIRLWELTTFLLENCIYTTNALRAWLTVDTSADKLRLLPGIGPKTVDYLKKLSGSDSVAVDRHIRAFVLRAGVPFLGYDETRRVVEAAADLLCIPRAALDQAIWRYESSGRQALLVCDRRALSPDDDDHPS